MQHFSRAKWVFASLAICAALGTGAVLAQKDAGGMTAGDGVTLVNNSNHDITIFARFGSDESSCEHKPSQLEIQVPAKGNSKVDSGSTKVCFCLDIPSRDTCPNGWGQIKAGGKRVFQ